MYYPYLRGRQYELIALREYAKQRGDKNNIVPIIEPVKNTYNSMNLALPKLIDSGVKFALILNPQVGDIYKDSTRNNNQKLSDLLEALNDSLADTTKWIPAYIVTNNYVEVKAWIEGSAHNNVMLILSDNTDIANNDFEELIGIDNIGCIVSKENKSLKRKLKNTNVGLIRLDDKFNPKKRNSDYLPQGEEKFTDEHLFYKDDKYLGFSDYTALTSDFAEGGMTPYAVAVHLTYEKENEEVWIRHFTSEHNEGMANIQGKFAEAAQKAVAFIVDKKIDNFAVNELRKYYEDKKYPGLGTIKKISIKNHLELINSII